MRNFKRNMQSQMKREKDFDELCVEATGPRDRPLTLPKEVDDLFQQMVFSLRMSGSPISADIVVAAAKGIVVHKNISLLKEYSGSVALMKSWAKSFLNRLSYIKQKGTHTARKIPA